MTIPNMQYAAYMKTQNITDHRTNQANILREAANRLLNAQSQWGDVDVLHDALTYNLRFWTIIQSDTSDNSCPHPNNIRLNLLKLSNFIDKHTLDIYADPWRDKLTILININKNLALGLEGDPG